MCSRTAVSLLSNSTYQVEIVKDTVALSGMQAPGVGIGKADSDVMIEKELSESLRSKMLWTHPCFVLSRGLLATSC